MWIRSQDEKRIVNTETVTSIEISKGTLDSNKKYQISAIVSGVRYGSVVNLGDYSSEERAKKIRENIESALENEYLSKVSALHISNLNVALSNFIFKMPKE